MEKVMVNHARAKRDNLLYDTMHYIFGLDNEAYQKIDDLGNNQEKLIESLRSQNQKILLLHEVERNDTTQLRKTFDENFNLAHKELTELANSEALIVAFQLASDIVIQMREKYKDMVNPTLHDLSKFKAQGFGVTLENKIVRSWNEGKLTVYTDHCIFETKEYQTYKLNYLPQKGEDGFLVISHHASVLALRNDTYVMFTEKEWQSCIREQEGLAICHITMEGDIKENPSCVLRYFRQNTQIKDCPVEEIHLNRPIFKKTLSANTWLYASATRENTTLVCGKNRTQVVIEEVGILHLDATCVVETRFGKLKSITQNAVKLTKARIAYGKIQAQGMEEFEKQIIASNEEYPNSRKTSFRKFSRHLKRHSWAVSSGTSITTIVIIIIILTSLYKRCLRPKLKVFDIPK